MWLLAGVYIVIQIGVYMVNLWMPLILSELAHGGRDDSSLIARYATVPYIMAAVFTVLVGWSSDRTNERRGHLAGCMAACGGRVCVGGEGAEYPGGAVRNVGGGDWALEHDGAVLGADDSHDWRALPRRVVLR